MSKTQSTSDMQSAVQLCAGVLPVWIRQLASSRKQSEDAVHSMLEAFAEIDPGLRQARQHAGELPDSESGDSQPNSDLANAVKAFLLPHLKAPDESAHIVSSLVGLLKGAGTHADSGGKGVSTAVDRMYIGLQYQDRIAQMMALLEQDMQRLQKEIADADASPTSLADWLARLEAQYAMAEQRAVHTGDASAAGNNSSDETTFF